MSTDIVQVKFSIRIPSKGTWLSQISQDYPNIKLSIVSLLPVGPLGGNALTVFRGTEVPRCVSELKPENGIIVCTILHQETNTILANLKLDRTITLHTITELEIPIKYPIIVAAGQGIMEFITERWRVDEFITKLNENGFTIEVQRIGPVSMKSLLTETQEHILNIALEKNYFEIPRGIELHELAVELGIGASSLSEILRRIFKKLALNYELENDS